MLNVLDLLLLDWLLDVDIFFDVFVDNVAGAETNRCYVTMVVSMLLVVVANYTTVLSSELLFLLE